MSDCSSEGLIRTWMAYWSFAEIESLMLARFPDVTHSEVRAILKAADKNHDGKIDFHELFEYTHSTDPVNRKLRERMVMALVAPGLAQGFRESEDRLQFRKADLNLDGQLDISEVESMMRRRFPDIKRRDVGDIFHAVDRNHDGQLDFQEVIEYTRSKDPSSRRLRDKLLQALAACEGYQTLASSASEPASAQKNSGMRRVSSASAVGSLIARPTRSA